MRKFCAFAESFIALMKMLKTILICLYTISASVFAYKIPNIDFLLFNDGFQVSIPDEMGMKRVLYIFQIDETCPALMDYITEAVDGNWTSIQKRKLVDNDKVLISAMVQYNDDIYDKTETKVIVYGQLKTLRVSKTNSHNFTNECQQYWDLDIRSSGSCLNSQTIMMNNLMACRGEIVFEDNFDGATLNRFVWTYDIRHRMYGNDEELVVFTDNKENSFVSNGHLFLVPIIAKDIVGDEFSIGKRCTAIVDPKRECNIPNMGFYVNPPVSSAQIHTKNSFNFKYGRIEIRAKLPKGDWLFPYLMLQPISTYAETQFPNQIRIAFARGNTHLQNIHGKDISGKRLYGGTAIYKNGTQFDNFFDHLAEKHYADDFHNYSLTWQADRITVEVDGEVYGDFYNDVDYFDEKCFIVFGVTVGGFYNFEDNFLAAGMKPYLNGEPKAPIKFFEDIDSWEPTWREHKEMEIDYVRVYAI